MSISPAVQDVEIFLGKDLQVWVTANVNGIPLPFTVFDMPRFRS
jgi:hypothetical protein